MPQAHDQAAEQKISAARTKLILDKPFLGALVLRLGLQNADPAWCATTGTDAKKFYYNAEYIKALTPSELQFVLSHEALHCALSHFARRQHRIKHRWDLACDYAINPILIDEGLNPPPNVMIMDEYREMSAEEIYPLLKDNDHSETMDQHLYDKPDKPKEGGNETQQDALNQQKTKTDKDPQDQKSEQAEKSNNGNQAAKGQADAPQSKNNHSEQRQDFNPDKAGSLKAPPPTLSPAEIEDLQEKWQQRLAGAAQQAKLSGKMSAMLARFIESEMTPRLPWRQLLATHLSATARDDYSYARPNARRGDPAIFPVLKSAQLNVVIAIDVSGSISDDELKACLSEINAIKGQLRAKATIIAADDVISQDYPKVFEPWQPIEINKPIQGGGGTDFRPVFDWMASQDVPADVLVYFTDAQGTFPDTAPHYPVVWLIKGGSKVPWGNRVQLN